MSGPRLPTYCPAALPPPRVWSCVAASATAVFVRSDPSCAPDSEMHSSLFRTQKAVAGNSASFLDLSVAAHPDRRQTPVAVRFSSNSESLLLSVRGSPSRALPRRKTRSDTAEQNIPSPPRTPFPPGTTSVERLSVARQT